MAHKDVVDDATNANGMPYEAYYHASEEPVLRSFVFTFLGHTSLTLWIHDDAKEPGQQLLPLLQIQTRPI